MRTTTLVVAAAAVIGYGLLSPPAALAVPPLPKTCNPVAIPAMGINADCGQAANQAGLCRLTGACAPGGTAAPPQQPPAVSAPAAPRNPAPMPMGPVPQGPQNSAPAAMGPPAAYPMGPPPPPGAGPAVPPGAQQYLSQQYPRQACYAGGGGDSLCGHLPEFNDSPAPAPGSSAPANSAPAAPPAIGEQGPAQKNPCDNYLIAHPDGCIPYDANTHLANEPSQGCYLKDKACFPNDPNDPRLGIMPDGVGRCMLGRDDDEGCHPKPTQ